MPKVFQEVEVRDLFVVSGLRELLASYQRVLFVVQIDALTRCVDTFLRPNYAALATPDYVTALRIAICHIP